MNAAGITVAVASCGRPDALARCLAALAGQSEAPAAVIVVDQAPSDEARAVVRASELADVSYVEQPRLGLSASRNLALSVAHTAVLAVTDDDCEPDRDWIAALRLANEQPPAPVALTGPILALDAPPEGGFAISLREAEVAVDYRGRVEPWAVGSGGNFAAPVEILRRHGGWDERLGTGSGGQAAEDADLIYRLLLGGGVIRYSPAAIVRHAWQTRERRMATRWSYGFGIGAMCGLWLGRADLFALRVLASYARLHVRPLLGAVVRRDRGDFLQHWLALVSTWPGLVYGIRNRRQPASRSNRGQR